MELKDMNLQAVDERLAELDVEVRSAESVETIDAAAAEKKSLLERRSELADLEERKQTALELNMGKAPDKVIETREVEKHMELTNEQLVGSPEFRSGWLKRLQGNELSDVEKRSNEVVSTSVAGAIPTQTHDQILAKIVQLAPLLSEVTLLHVRGNLKFAIEDANEDASLHDEAALITASPDTLGVVSLGGYEIVKLLRISQTVQTMTINAFETWLTDQLAAKVAQKIEQYLILGDGLTMPKGVDYARTWVDKTNAVSWSAAEPTYKEMVSLVGLLKGGYARTAKFLMNHKTFWSQVQAIRDDGKYPIAQADGAIYRIMGYPVLISDFVPDGDMFFGAFKNIVANLSQDITVSRSTESGFIYNAIDYRGAAMFDSDVAIPEAFVKGAKTLTAGA